MQTFVLSVGGSLVAPDGVDGDYVTKLVAFVKKHVNKRFVLVIGGGRTGRTYQEAAKACGVTNAADLDWIGTRSTHLNAELVRTVFGGLAHLSIVMDPSRPPKSSKRVIVAGGWKPGWSSDYDAVLLATKYKTKHVINLSNIDYVYDRDPRTNIGAKRLEKLSWKAYLKLIGAKWEPGRNVPFDPIASKLAAKHKISVVICNGRLFDNVENVLAGKPYAGTTISQ